MLKQCLQHLSIEDEFSKDNNKEEAVTIATQGHGGTHQEAIELVAGGVGQPADWPGGD